MHCSSQDRICLSRITLLFEHGELNLLINKLLSSIHTLSFYPLAQVLNVSTINADKLLSNNL